MIDARIRKSSTGRYMDRLLDHLQKIDKHNNYTVIVKPADDWSPCATNFTAIKCKYKPYSYNIVDQITFSFWLMRLGPDLVHFTITPQEPFFYFSKRVTTTHDLTMLQYARAGNLPNVIHMLRMFGYRFLLWYSHKVSLNIIVPTKYVANDIKKLHPFTSKKISVTYESSEPPINDRPQPLVNIRKQFILHVGSPLPHKNIERLIDAFEVLKKRHSSLQLVLVGKKEYHFEQLEKSVSYKKVESSVVAPGFVNDSELKWLYQNATAYVLPSLSEGFGLPGLEAMAHGCPLVSSNATCLPEVYGNAAVFFNPLDINDMAKKIESVIADQGLRDQLKARGYTQLEKFSWEKMAKETLAVYESVLSS